MSNFKENNRFIIGPMAYKFYLLLFPNDDYKLPTVKITNIGMITSHMKK